MEKITGRVRGLQAQNSFENHEEDQVTLDSLGDLVIAQSGVGLSEIVRLGDSWQVLSAAWTGLTGIPTTVAIQRLWNGDSKKLYVIDSVCVFRPIIDVTTDDQFSVFGQVVSHPVALITDDGTVIRGLSGRGYDGRARKDTGSASSAISGRWDFLGTSPPNATAIAGTGWTCVDIPLTGRYIVQPFGAFGIHVVEVTATASAFRSAIRWHEVLL